MIHPGDVVRINTNTVFDEDGLPVDAPFIRVGKVMVVEPYFAQVLTRDGEVFGVPRLYLKIIRDKGYRFLF